MIFVTTIIGNQQEKIHTIATARPWRRIWDRKEIIMAEEQEEGEEEEEEEEE